MLVSIGRNVNRVLNEYNIYNYNILKNPSYNRNFQNFAIYDQINEILECKSDCAKYSIKVKKVFNRNIFYR